MVAGKGKQVKTKSFQRIECFRWSENPSPAPSGAACYLLGDHGFKVGKHHIPPQQPLNHGRSAAGAVARMSDRIIDCPAKVIVIWAEFGLCATVIAPAIASRTAGAPPLSSGTRRS